MFRALHETNPISNRLAGDDVRAERPGDRTSGRQLGLSLPKRQLAELGLCGQRPRLGNRRRRHHFPQFRKHLALICLSLLLAGCATAHSAWRFDAIDSGDARFNSTRLTFSDPISPLRFELLRSEETLEAFLSLTKYRFTGTEVKTVWEIDGERWEGPLPVLEGKMRLKLPPALTDKIVHSLKEGRQVAIMVDGFEEHLTPDRFGEQYDKLTGASPVFRSPLKGLFTQ